MPTFRNPSRMAGYDYQLAGIYFVTIVTCRRQCLLSTIENGVVHLLSAGHVSMDVWSHLPDHFPALELGDIVIMPNHIHALLVLKDAYAAGQSPAATSLSVIVGEWKSYTTKQVNRMQGTSGETLWQRGFYDRIIRSEDEWQRINLYITSNPARWLADGLEMLSTIEE